MHKITVMPEGREIEISAEQTLLEALKSSGTYIKASCGGHASCSDCVVKIVAGEGSINTPSFEELSLLGNVFHITKERLSCQVKVSGDISIDTSSHNEKDDQEKLLNKSPKKVMKRSKKQAEKIIEERRAKSAEKKAIDEESWQKHWETPKDGESQVQKKLGGGRRPKLFRTDHLDEDDKPKDPEKK